MAIFNSYVSLPEGTVIIRGRFYSIEVIQKTSQAASSMGDVLNDAHLNDRFWLNASNVLIENRLFLDKGCQKKKDFTRGFQHSPETKLGTSTVYPINRCVGCVHFPCENAWFMSSSYLFKSAGPSCNRTYETNPSCYCWSHTCLHLPVFMNVTICDNPRCIWM